MHLAKVRNAIYINSKITQYEEGNKFASAMIAGLGQIHIDGDFTLTIASKQDETLAEFTLNKTFAWGGIYGAIPIGIEDVEPAFADGVASAIVVQTPKQTREEIICVLEIRERGTKLYILHPVI